MKRLRISGLQSGFTIVELMIATLVFSIILLVVTFGVLAFSRAYYKGVTTASTQDTARTVLDRITQGLQFNGGAVSYATSGGSPADPITTYCVGTKQYDFLLGTQQTDTNHVIYETPRDSAATCARKTFDTTESKDLLSKHMRLADFSLTPPSGTDGLFEVHIRVVYGDDDLLKSPSGATIPTTEADQTVCLPDAGSQFCAVADLVTTVVKRIK